MMDTICLVVSHNSSLHADGVEIVTKQSLNEMHQMSQKLSEISFIFLLHVKYI